MSGSAENLMGLKFGRLIVKERSGTKGSFATWLCLCECGGTKIVRSADLKRGKTKSCGCLRKACNNENMAKRAANLRKPFGKAAFNSLYFDYKYNAKVRGLIFELNKVQFKYLTKQNCAYCGSEPNNHYIKRNVNGGYVYNGIDRIDNNKGYVFDNCAACCKFCNYAKNRGTKKEFLVWISRLVSLRS